MVQKLVHFNYQPFPPHSYFMGIYPRLLEITPGKRCCDFATRITLGKGQHTRSGVSSELQIQTLAERAERWRGGRAGGGGTDFDLDGG